MIVLQNSRLQVVVHSTAGGRIEDIIDLKHGKNWLWHPPGYQRNEPRKTLERGASFDDNWQGGAEDIFPNDAAGKFQGMTLTDHGDLWRQEWRLLSSHENEVGMEVECDSVNVRVEKWIRLEPNSAKIEINYNFYNNSPNQLPYLFKLHPALAIEVGDEFLMPGCYIEPVSLDFSRLIGQDKQGVFPYGWTAEGEPIKINKALPPEENRREFVYGSGLESGWCGVRNPRTQTDLIFEFSKKEFPYVWIFQSYGGFRGHYVAMLEPATTMPYDLSEACQNKTCAILASGESRSYGMTMRVRDYSSD